MPRPLTIGAAMDQSVPLARLLERLRESQARLAASQAMLPPALRAHVRAGPVDEEGWTLLAGNPAVAAKLRHLLPLLEQGLAEQGFAARPLKVRVYRA